MKKNLALVIAAFCFIGATQAHAQAAPTLLHHNPGELYFRDASNKAIFLNGSHTWTNGSANFSNLGTFSQTQYYNLLNSEGANLIRYWTWDATIQPSYKWGNLTTPAPFNRTTSGARALDNGYKFDLNSFNQDYFDRLKANVISAGQNGKYVSVMLFFDYWTGVNSSTWNYDWWNGANNINGTTTSVTAVQQGTNANTLALQKNFVAKVLDTLKDQSNVLYEITNEPMWNSSVNNWQNVITDFIRSYEQSHGYLHHPVGITSNYPTKSLETSINSWLNSSHADWISYCCMASNPPTATGNKVSITDTDHSSSFAALAAANSTWVWQEFTRGHNVWIMDDMHNTNVPGAYDFGNSTWWTNEASARVALKQTRTVANMLDMTTMKPLSSLSPIGYVLADPDKGQYVVYSQAGGNVTVNLSGAAGKTLKVQWLNVGTSALTTGSSVPGGGSATVFPAPAANVVLVLTDVARRPAPRFPRTAR